MIGNTKLKSNNLASYPEPKKVTPYVKLKDFSHFVELVLKWAEERNLLEGATNKQQSAKLWEEAGELLKNHLAGKDTRDDVGDILVVLVQMVYREYGDTFSDFEQDLFKNYSNSRGAPIEPHVQNILFTVGDMCCDMIGGYACIYSLVADLARYCQSSDLDILVCCEIAYNDIRNRTGKMVNGNFVKDV